MKDTIIFLCATLCCAMITNDLGTVMQRQCEACGELLSFNLVSSADFHDLKWLSNTGQGVILSCFF